MTYTDFAEDCIQQLQDLQEVFQYHYNLDWYENWFYNQATGLLTFSTEEVELNFKYLKVGSFSRNTNTWMWSWHNDDTLQKAKEGIDTIRNFGEELNFTKLTNGYFESSEEEAWEFTAITAKLVNGIGAYRPVSEHLLIFMVILEEIDNDTAKNIKDKYVMCNAHEYARRAFVCKHLNRKNKVGFEEAFETFENMELLEDDDFQAWCDECEKVREKEDGWNDVAMKFADIKIICEHCYFAMKELNLGYK